jgi:hypothetical protein
VTIFWSKAIAIPESSERLPFDGPKHWSPIKFISVVERNESKNRKMAFDA